MPQLLFKLTDDIISNIYNDQFNKVTFLKKDNGINYRKVKNNNNNIQYVHKKKNKNKNGNLIFDY